LVDMISTDHRLRIRERKTNLAASHPSEKGQRPQERSTSRQKCVQKCRHTVRGWKLAAVASGLPQH